MCGVAKIHVGCGVATSRCGGAKIGCGVAKIGCGVAMSRCGVVRIGCGLASSKNSDLKRAFTAVVYRLEIQSVMLILSSLL